MRVIRTQAGFPYFHWMKKKTICFILLVFLGGMLRAQSVYLSYDRQSLQQGYAASVLSSALKEKKYLLDDPNGTFSIHLSVDQKSLMAESFRIGVKGQRITVTGGDDRGLIYGSMALAEEIRNGVPVKNTTAQSGKPFLPFRAIKYDLPWDTYRHSDALALHDQTCRDTNYWRTFLDMMAENRFNTLTLWNLHPYTFFIKPANFPEASPWNDEEMKQWQTLFQSVSRMAQERAIDLYIVPFNIFVTPEFSKAHNVTMDNLHHDYYVKGDTAEIIKRYTRECVTQMLNEYPGITGMGLTLGEGMGGMTPQQREDWMRETIIEGMRLANRKTKLIHRIPFSSNTASLGTTSIETEKLTRRSMEQEAAMGFIKGPIWADLKFNWSHAHSTTKLVKVHGGKLYDTYFKPESDDYKIVWTARNEDFFCLRWGVPGFVRRHITDNKRSYSGGYIIGSETYIPAKDYFTSDTAGISWKYAFERQWLFYKLWGRMLYDPNTPERLFHAEFTRRYGAKGKNLLQASALAGNTALRIASAFDSGWDFTLYTEGFMALDTTTKRVDYITLDRLIHRPALDPEYVSIDDYTKGQTKDFPKNKITPPMLASRLQDDCRQALRLIESIDVTGNKTLMYEVADIKTWAFLGLHFAEKIMGAVALQSYRRSGQEPFRQKAIAHLQNALANWDTIIKITRPIYHDMPLVHLSQQGGKESQDNFYLRFHWEKLRDAVASDIETARQAKHAD